MLPRHSLLLSHAPHSTSCHRLPLFTSPTIPTTSILPRKTLSENAFRLRNFRKHCTKLLFACGTSARITQNCIVFAELPQILHKNVSCLRKFRKYCTKTSFACGTSANGMQFKNTPYYIIAPFAR